MALIISKMTYMYCDITPYSTQLRYYVKTV